MSDLIRYPTTDITDRGNRPGDGPLRAGGQPAPPSMLPASESNLPSTLSQAASRQQKALTLVRDISAGTEKIQDRTTVYLPQALGEDPINYRGRLKRSVFFNVFAHTIEGLVGQVFRRDPQLSDDVPTAIAGTDTQPGHWENIDLAGTHGDVFCRDILEDALTAGHAAILVDFPVTGGTQNAAQEKEIRPYWVPILKDNILSWRHTVEHGRMVLTQLVLRECQMVPDGMFGEKEQTRYRVLFRDTSGQAPVVGFRLLEVTDDKRVLELAAGFYRNQDEIPVAEVVTSGRESLFESIPPLLDLAYVNLTHYQMLSDYLNSIHLTCVPILFLAGFDDFAGDETKSAVVIGPSTFLKSSNPQAKAEYVSHTGDALGAAKQALDDLKSDMGTLGLSMLAPSKRTAETAQAKRLDKATEDSALAVTARGLQDGLERALHFHAKYLLLPDGGSVKINKEFDTQQMEADMLTAWTNAVANGGVPERLMLKAMQIGELIDPDEDIDDIANEMASNAAAIADQQQQAAMDQLKLKTGQAPAATPIPKPEPEA